MLTQIERAFRERAASEDRLRRFVGDASHELRTPLTSIRGYAELFKDGVGGRPEDLASALRRIESESTRMGGLVDDLLLLARLDQGRPLGHDRVDLAQLAVDAVQDASVVDPSRTIAVISAGPCVVVGDDQRLRQVVGNLITNAMAYSPPGSPIEVAVHMEGAPVDISGLPGIPAIPTVGRFGRVSRSGRLAGSTDPVSLPVRPLGPADLTASGQGEGVSGNGGGEKSDIAGVGRYLAPDQVVDPVTAPSPRTDVSAWQETRAVIAVIDHGPGIAPEIMPHVFERFWRADQSRQRSSGGSGLGLSIVAAVVAAHGGEVGIRQTPGGGATFAVELPAAPPPPPLGSVAGNGSVSGAISPSEVAD
jgi:two-component system OmpR family sensor kinase